MVIKTPKNKQPNMETIGVPIAEARNKVEFKKIPDFYSKLTDITFDVLDISLKHVISRPVLPEFLPRTQTNINKAKKSTKDQLAQICNVIAKDVSSIWSYLKLLMPLNINIPDDDIQDFDFVTFFLQTPNYMDFKVICRFWIFKLENLIGLIRSVFHRSVRRCTQIALAVIATQPKGYAERLEFYIATFNDLLITTEPASQQTKDFMTHFVKWFSNILNTCQWDALAIKQTEIAIKLEITTTEISNFIDNREWLSNALNKMYMTSLHSFYSQMYLSSLHLCDKTGDWFINLSKENQEVLSSEAKCPINDSPAAQFTQEFTDVLIKSRDISQLDITNDIQIISNSLHELYSTNDLAEETLVNLNQIMQKVSGYDIETFMDLLDFSAFSMHKDIEKLNPSISLIQNNLREIQEKLTKLVAQKPVKRKVLEEYENTFSNFSINSIVYKDLETFFMKEENVLKKDVLFERAKNVYLTNPIFNEFTEQDKTTFLEKLLAYTKLQNEIITLVKQKKEMGEQQQIELKQGYSNLLLQIRNNESNADTYYYQFLQSVVKHSGNALTMDMLIDDTLPYKNDLQKLIRWMETEGMDKYLTDAADVFYPEVSNFFPFNVLASDRAVQEEIVDRLYLSLNSHNTAKIMTNESQLYVNELEETKRIRERLYFVMIVIGFFLFGFGLWFGLPYLVTYLRTPVAPKTSGAIGKAISIATEGAWNFLTRHLDMSHIPLTSLVTSGARSLSVMLFLQYPSFDDINPIRVVESFWVGTSLHNPYAVIFWGSAIWVGRALLALMNTWSQWAALKHVRSIDNSPELQFDTELSLIIDREREQRIVVIERFANGVQQFVQTGNWVRGAAISMVAYNFIPMLPPSLKTLVLTKRPNFDKIMNKASKKSFEPVLPMLEYKRQRERVYENSNFIQQTRTAAIEGGESKTSQPSRIEEID